MIPELENVDIKASWYLDYEDLHEEKLEIEKKMRQLLKERKLQPVLIMQGHMGVYEVSRYKIIDLDKGVVCAERQKLIESSGNRTTANGIKGAEKI